jgi:hypothetical protein
LKIFLENPRATLCPPANVRKIYLVIAGFEKFLTKYFYESEKIKILEI